MSWPAERQIIADVPAQQLVVGAMLVLTIAPTGLCSRIATGRFLTKSAIIRAENRLKHPQLLMVPPGRRPVPGVERQTLLPRGARKTD